MYTAVWCTLASIKATSGAAARTTAGTLGSITPRHLGGGVGCVRATCGGAARTTAGALGSITPRHFMGGASSLGGCRWSGASPHGVGEARGGATTAVGGHLIRCTLLRTSG